MKKEIFDDVYSIVKRIKALDKDYFVMYDYCSQCYELHHKKEKPTYLISLGKKLNRQSLVKVYKSQSKNSIEIFRSIERTNSNLEKYATKLVFDKAKNTLKEQLNDDKYF